MLSAVEREWLQRMMANQHWPAVADVIEAMALEAFRGSTTADEAVESWREFQAMQRVLRFLENLAEG